MTATAVRVRRFSTRTTPGRFRLSAAVTGAILAAAALAGTLSAVNMRSATRAARSNSGPVLVATQGLVSSLAEADAAATAAYFSAPDEDPEQRRLYEQALGRAGAQLEDIASLAGSDEATHARLQEVSVAVTRYAGLVEAARTGRRAGAPGADQDLGAAVTLLDRTVRGDAKDLTDATQTRLRRDDRRRDRGFPLAAGVLALGLAAVLAGQVLLAARTRRVLNPGLVVATACAVAALAWLVAAERHARTATARARTRGYDSIAFTAGLQTTAFAAKADETLALITGDPGRRAEADAALAALATGAVTPEVVRAIRDGTAGGAPGGLIGQAATAADTPRERAAVAEVADRWQRYRDTVGSLRAAPTPAAARTIAVGPAAATFSAFNFSVEAVLGQNRDQFLGGLVDAAGGTRRAPPAVLLLTLAAAGAVLAGFQIRVNEYR